jgi:hypothetical protein
MTERDSLPIPDYDHLPAGSLAGRIRTLDADGLETLLAYERAHGDRLPVTELLTRRLEALRSGDAEPSGGDPAAAQPEHAPPAAGDSPGQNSGQTDNNQPLRHGVAGQTPNRDVRAR